ncbi:MAG: alcohol dehydrogenase catalytic domain-containing protein [Promethearchaeota archaeon]
MKAAIYKGIGQISVEEIKKPLINENEYLVKVLYSGLCGTDVKTFKQGHKFFTPPCILGHEFSGIIEDVGSNLDKSMMGKKVTCAPYVCCYSCEECDNGFYELCKNKDRISSGTFTEYITIPLEVAKKGMVIVDNNSDLREIALAEPLACVLNSIEKSNFKPGQNVLIMGAGPMGLIHVEVLKKFGANKIFISEFITDRLKVAKEIGAIPINPKNDDVIKTITKKTNGKGVNLIIVAIGISSAVEESFNYVSNGGVINVFGGLQKNSRISIDPNIIHYNEVSLIGSFGFSPKNFRMAVKLIESGKISLKKIITHEFDIDDIEEAFKKSLKYKTIKSIIKIWE